MRARVVREENTRRTRTYPRRAAVDRRRRAGARDSITMAGVRPGNPPMTYLPVVVAIVVFATIALLLRWRYRAQIASLRAAELDRRREAILAIQDELREVVEDERSTPDDVERRAAEVIDRLQAYNEEGQIEALIEDDRSWVAERLAARRGRGG